MEKRLTHVYFVRHCQPNNENHDEPTRELTEKGMRDRALVTAFLADKRVDAVLSSPYKRAVDTVAHYANARGMEIVTIDDFCERRTGGWVTDFETFARRQWADFDYGRGHGETLREVQARCVAALQQVIFYYAGRTVIVGAHGTALSCTVNAYQPVFGVEDFLRILPLTPWVVRFDFDGETCVGIEEYDLFAGKAGKIL